MNIKRIHGLIAGLLIWLILSCQPEKLAVQSPRFNHVYLTVDNLETSIEFYTTAFDLKVTDRVKKLKQTLTDGTVKEVDVNMAFLSFPDQNFLLEIGERQAFRSKNDSANYAHLGVDVIDIEAAEKRLLKAGATLMRPITLVEANEIKAKNSFYKGPNGESIELMQIIEGEF